jgi:DNA polymerase elongation subunit (family B)
MRPDIIMGFNDSSYDWNWVYERAKKYKLVSYLTDKFDLIKKDRSETD